MKLSGSAALPSMLQIPGYMAVIKKDYGGNLYD